MGAPRGCLASGIRQSLVRVPSSSSSPILVIYTAETGVNQSPPPHPSGAEFSVFTMSLSGLRPC